MQQELLGLTDYQIIIKHILPNSLISVVTFLPFRISGAILILTSLDFLGLGVPSTTPSLGELSLTRERKIYQHGGYL